MAPSGNTPQPQQLMAAGLEALKQSRLDIAERQFRHVLDLVPGQPDALHLLANVLGQRGHLSEARKLVDKAIKADGRRGAYYNTLGNIRKQQGEDRSALRAYARAVDLEPRLLGAQFNLGLIHFEAGHLDAAAAAFDTVLATVPAHFDALMQRGLVAWRRHEADEARRFFESALRARSDSPDAHFHLGVVLLHSGALMRALAALERAHALAPQRVQPRLSIARVQRTLGQLNEAAATLQHALKVHPAHADLLAELGGVRQAQGALDEALECFLASLDARDNPITAASLAELYLWQGEPDKAGDLLAAYSSEARPQVAIVKARLGLAENAPSSAALEAWLTPPADEGLSRIEKRQLAFCLGDVWHARREQERAFEWYTRANALVDHDFDMNAMRQHVATQIRCFDKPAFTQFARTDAADVGPLFIVGMPRSGTTLLEQMLGMHTKIEALGERADIGRIYHQLHSNGPLRETLAAQTTGLLNALANEYLDAQPFACESRWITDKMPLNFLYLGLIAMLFPRARVIHCRRQPEAIALSCFRQDFTDPNLAFSADLDTLGQYMAEHDRLMNHWKSVLPLGVFDVSYEALVNDPTAELTRVLGELDLSFEPACLAFDRAQRFVNTASHAQVKRGLYSNALRRHDRYAEALTPFTLSYARHA